MLLYSLKMFASIVMHFCHITYIYCKRTWTLNGKWRPVVHQNRSKIAGCWIVPLCSIHSLWNQKRSFLCCRSLAINFKANKPLQIHFLSVVLTAQTSLLSVFQHVWFNWLFSVHWPFPHAIKYGFICGPFAAQEVRRKSYHSRIA